MMVGTVVFPKLFFEASGSLFTLSFIGITMIFSKKLRESSFVGKTLYWFAINIMKPRSRFNHMIWGLFIFGCGLLSLIPGDKPAQNNIEFINQIQKSYEFWIAILVVIVFNVLVGIYTAKKYKKG